LAFEETFSFSKTRQSNKRWKVRETGKGFDNIMEQVLAGELWSNGYVKRNALTGLWACKKALHRGDRYDIG